MTNLDPTIVANYEQALGVAAFASLAQRELLRSIHTPTPGDDLDDGIVTDRIYGAVFGLAMGDAFADWVRRSRTGAPVMVSEIRNWLERESQSANGEPISASTQTFAITADALLRDVYRAPLTLAHELTRQGRTLRSPGRAIRHVTNRLQHGAPWYQAAAPSYGDAALPRAVAVGLRLHRRPELIGMSASLDTVVTHAARRAASSSAALAAIVAGLVTRSETVMPSEVVADVVSSIDDARVREVLEAVLVGAGEFAEAFEPTATNALLVALWSQQYGPDLAPVLQAGTVLSGGDRVALAITAALHGAAGGMRVLPQRAWSVGRSDDFMRIAHQLADAGAVTASQTDGNDPAPSDSSAGADIWFLVDRSGSMSSISQFVVSGFDEFFTKQRAESGEAMVTVVQFDDEAPHDVLVDAQSLGQVPSIRDRFEPRGMTPLYDAVGLLLDRAERHGGHDADQLVVILTDGMENASTTWTHHTLFRRIAGLRQRGWTFVFLGANQDSYEAGGQMAMPAGNVSNFRADESGVHAAYTGLDRTVTEWRSKARSERRRDADQFWGGTKEAEESL